MNVAKLYARGQITLPKEIREELGVSPGDTVVIESRNGEALLRKPRGILEAEGIGAPRRRAPWKKARAAAQEERARNRASR